MIAAACLRAVRSLDRLLDAQEDLVLTELLEHAARAESLQRWSMHALTVARAIPHG
jgi:hypothetical protein